MADVQHASLTGALLHEPKGVDAAAANRVYVSDGAGSGSWKQLTIGTEVAAPTLSPKAAVSFTVSGGVVSIVASFNVASVTRTSVGNFTITFTTPIVGNYYSFVSSQYNITSEMFGEFPATCGIVTFQSNTLAATDAPSVQLIVFGS